VAHGFRATFLAQKRTGFHEDSSTEERLKACCSATIEDELIATKSGIEKTQKFRT
jgi:hypothetical protein